MSVDEKLFEDAIEEHLLTEGGYLKSIPSSFDPVLGLDPSARSSRSAAPVSWHFEIGELGGGKAYVPCSCTQVFFAGPGLGVW